jgi:hypothetical protein
VRRATQQGGPFCFPASPPPALPSFDVLTIVPACFVMQRTVGTDKKLYFFY